MKIYVASSWRNTQQPLVVEMLRDAGHEVYDFKNPPNGSGFGWSQIDPAWKTWTAAKHLEAHQHPLALEGFASDFGAMEWADACVMVQRCGVSAALELGFMAGRGKPTIVLLADGIEPELMLKLATACVQTGAEMLDVLASFCECGHRVREHVAIECCNCGCERFHRA